MLQTIDVGLVVLDSEYRINVWNSFMENHSGLRPHVVKDRVLFEVFKEIPEEWFKHKTQSVFLLKNRTFTTWEQRPFLFRFKNYRPITGTEEFMYQNITITPLVSPNGEVQNICLIIYDVTDIASNRRQLEAANSKLEKLSRIDRLTQLNNRGYWEEQLVKEYQRVKRTNEASTLIMFDIDHFKKVNDTYGHPAGDEVIRVVSAALRDTMRSTDIAGRYGGEEFSVILVNTDGKNAMNFAERLRTRIENLEVTHEGRDIRFTISLGLAELDKKIKDHKEWIERADTALYASKQGGRNRATTYEK
ncbi:Response regulator containing a CheY-like receiver domain and a GGDEF domain [Hahella chejuensis KCTC 2396]|uniref:diguanylate cyclase n=2 Tax=Hahella chejuensis TaxID=158327 RepID=Q2SLF8_HAHCH|nr:Response regulator containing a CheY-like receiver domain and a GGDEF domain [Hahella chejuensis KCTC 2396]